MCDVAEQLENEGIKKGIIQGKIQGKIEGKIEGKIQVYFFDMHLPAKDIAKKVNISEDEVKQIIREQEKDR